MFLHAHRVQKLTYTHQHYTDAGALYRITWPTLAEFGKYVRRRPAGHPVGPLLRSLRVLHIDYYDHRKLYVTECFPYLAGRALLQLHLHCDGGEDSTNPRDILELSRVLPLLPTTSPNLQYVSIRDTRDHPNQDVCPGLSTLLSRLRHLRHFSCSMTLEKQNLQPLSAMTGLTHLSLALHTNRTERPTLRLDASSPDFVPFRSLHTLILDVMDLDIATACISLIEPNMLRRLRLITPPNHDESALERCFAAAAKQKSLREFALSVIVRLQPNAPPALETDAMINMRSIAMLFALAQLEIFSLNAFDNARFETDLDDSGVQAMANAWPELRSFTVVQGSWAPRGVHLAPARTTMRSLLALRDHCPHLAGLSISLDTSAFDVPVLQAACAAGAHGGALRKLNIGLRSTAVSNPSVAAQVIHGLFPNLRTVHDGTPVAWDEESSDWQEVAVILRKMTQSRPGSPMLL